MRAALVIPAWNEPEAIGAVLDEVPRGLVERVFVVVAGPTDPTAVVAQAHGATVLVQQRPGYGAACWTGATQAMADGAQIVAFLDGDYADPPAELGRVLAPLLAGNADLMLGRRDLRRFPNALPKHAQLGNRLVLWILWRLLGTRVGDLPSFKAIRTDALNLLDMSEMTYGWTIEMIVKAARLGLAIEEVPIDYRPRLGGQSKVAGSLSGSVRAAAKLLRCAVHYASWLPRTGGEWSVASGQ